MHDKSLKNPFSSAFKYVNSRHGPSPLRYAFIDQSYVTSSPPSWYQVECDLVASVQILTSGKEMMEEMDIEFNYFFVFQSFLLQFPFVRQ